MSQIATYIHKFYEPNQVLTHICLYFKGLKLNYYIILFEGEFKNVLICYVADQNVKYVFASMCIYLLTCVCQPKSSILLIDKGS